MKTWITNQTQIEEIVETLLNDGVVAFPTETVYGLGVVYDSKKAIDRLIEAKRRDMSKRFTLMLADLEEINRYALVTERDRQVIKAFMPGDITVILKSRFQDETIGIRIPDDDFVRRLIRACKKPLYVTSANISHQPSAKNTKEVLDQLDGRINMVVEGECGSGEASTVVDLTQDPICVLRQGRITLEMIRRILNENSNCM